MLHSVEIKTRVADLHHSYADPDPDPDFYFIADLDPAFHFHADPDPAPLQSDANLRTTGLQTFQMFFCTQLFRDLFHDSRVPKPT